MKKILIASLLLSSVTAFAFTPTQVQLLQDFKTLLAMPNATNNLAQLKQNADEIKKLLEQSGLQAQLLTAKNQNVPPLIFAEWKVPNAEKTILFYAHYDGMPVTDSEWTVTKPYQPILTEKGRILNTAQTASQNTRLYARSATDDKSGVMAIIGAIRTMKANGQLPAVNVKVLFEGEEESGSDHLQQILTDNRELVKSDGWVIVDGGVHASGNKALIFGARGDMYLTLTIYGAKVPLHSGEYGSFAPNPAMQMARVLSSMQDNKGHVLIKGFYEDAATLGPKEHKAIAETPNVDQQLKNQYGFKQEETLGKTLAEVNNQPSLIVQGINSGVVADTAINLIPATASALIEVRLVKGNDWRKMADHLVEHVKQQGFEVLDHEPTDKDRATYPRIAKIKMGIGSYNGDRIALDSPFAKQIIDAVESGTATPLVIQPTDGGSLPLVAIKEATGAPTMSLGFANYDNNQHTFNENIRLGHFFDGIDTIMAIMKKA